MAVTVEVEIDHGRILARDPEKLPERGTGLLTITSSEGASERGAAQRVSLPLIRGNGRRMINPTANQLEASLWND